MIEYLGVKVFIILGFFAAIISQAFWANSKFKEYWEDNDKV